jgi:phosphoribosyl 1,2-cyclic phosphodiesterase
MSKKTSLSAYAAAGVSLLGCAAIIKFLYSTSNETQQYLQDNTYLYKAANHHNETKQQQCPDCSPTPAKQSEIIILGSGSSTAVPRAACLLDPHSTCSTCRKAVQGPPECNKNWRGNPSVLLKYFSSQHHDYRYIQIDVGKTFREAVLRWFPLYHIPRIDTVLITHDHADAILGFDDIRGLQKFDPCGVNDTPPLPVLISEPAYQSLKKRFDYLIPSEATKPKPTLDVNRNNNISVNNSNNLKTQPAGPTEESTLPPQVYRAVSQLKFDIIEHFQQLNIYGLPIIPIPLFHGNDYISLGFIIGSNSTSTVVYLSDVSKVPQESEAYIAKHVNHIDLLIVDSLFKTRLHHTHFNMLEALDYIRKIKPRRSLLIGLTDDFDYDVDNAELAKLKHTEGIDVQLCYDGMRIRLNL